MINLYRVNAMNGDVPNTVYTREDVSYDHLRVFGCRVYPMFMFLKMRDISLMTKWSYAVSQDLGMMCLNAGFAIQ